MSLYRCETCGCIENSACAQYWQRKLAHQPLLCSLCDPELREWHGLFPRQSARGMLIDRGGHLWHPRNSMTMPKDDDIVGIVQAHGDPRLPLSQSSRKAAYVLPPYRETVEELVEVLADMVGIAAQGLQEYSHLTHAPTCQCRRCWCDRTAQRIRAAVRYEARQQQS